MARAKFWDSDRPYVKRALFYPELLIKTGDFAGIFLGTRSGDRDSAYEIGNRVASSLSYYPIRRFVQELTAGKSVYESSVFR